MVLAGPRSAVRPDREESWPRIGQGADGEAADRAVCALVLVLVLATENCCADRDWFADGGVDATVTGRPTQLTGLPLPLPEAAMVAALWNRSTTAACDGTANVRFLTPAMTVPVELGSQRSRLKT